MSWVEWSAALGNIGEFLGSIGVFATLIYLAIQVRLIRTQSDNEHKAASNDVVITRNLRLINDRELLRLNLQAQKIGGYIRDTEQPFYRTLIDGGLEEEQVVLLYLQYDVEYSQFWKMARTAPNAKRAEVFINEYAHFIARSSLMSLWWESLGNFDDPNEERSRFTRRVNDKIEQINKDIA